MTGYQETLTDPSYHRQIVVMTAPHIGNTGVNDEDDESTQIWVAGYVVRDPARRASNWRSRAHARRRPGRPGHRRHQRDRHPRAHPPPARARRDARRHLLRRRAAGRERRAPPDDELLDDVLAAPAMVGADLAGEVSTDDAYVGRAGRRTRAVATVAAVDLGIKAMTPQRLAERGVRVHVLPSNATIDDVLATDAGRRLLLQRPRRPGRGDARDRAAARGAGPQDPVLRHLLRQPDPRPRPRLRHLQAGLRPPRHQPAGDGPRHRQGRDHRAQPRLRRRRAARRRSPSRRTTAAATAGSWSATSTSTTTSSRACAPRPAGVLGAVPPRGRRRPARRRVPLRPLRRPHDDRTEEG